MTAYYNEIDPYAAQWLRNLIDAGHIAPGDVDERSIVDVRPSDLAGYTQCHFFAGIGGWSIALRLAGWDDDRPVWTGSCPCQPFSEAGHGQGFADPRHLWPELYRLINLERPAIVFGEQTPKARLWLDGVCVDMETLGYAIGATVLPAGCVGAPHRRERLWFVAYANGEHGHWGRSAGAPGRDESSNGCRDISDANRKSLDGITEPRPKRSHWATEPDVGRVAHGIPARTSKLRAYGNAIVPQIAAEFIAAAREAIEAP